ncbi:MAG TPA: ATP-binding protein [Candidatus Didemnitutus sp.]|nr:ATP-binding protein [Candidatus Didemnitutus sp.]
MTRWWQSRPLWLRLALWYAVVGTVLLSGFSAQLYFYVSETLARPLDHHLRQDLAEVLKHLEIRDGLKVWWNGRELPEPATSTPQYPWFELWDENGQLVRRLWPFSESRVQQSPVAPAPGRETISVFSVAPDLRLRVLSVPYHVPGTDRTWMLRIMRIHDPSGDALGALRWIIFLTLPTVIVLLVVGGYGITRHWLKPLDRLTTEASRVSAENLYHRLPIDSPRDEVGRLGVAFNVTLDRLESSFTALDRFVADASHELRTPLTTLRSVGEVGLRRGRSEGEYREIIASMLEEAQRLHLLVERLLELAKAEGGDAQPHFAELQVDDCVRSCVADLSVLAESRGQQIAVATTPCVARTDAVLLRQALQNLVDNAVKYSPERSSIDVSVQARQGEIEIRVADEGPGIRPQDQARLTERFFRPDRARERATGGFGLGLSLTKAYMRMLGGRLIFEARPGGGSVFALILPGGGSPAVAATD